MSKQPKPWVVECVDYWSEKIYEGDIGVDWCNADTRCWRCGSERTLQRAARRAQLTAERLDRERRAREAREAREEARATG